jgi:hypothetical protein
VRPTNRTNMAAKSEAEAARGKLRELDKEIDKEEKGRAVVKPKLDHARNGGIY